MQRDNLILVTGATGRQGGAVARELLARRHNVRALTRKPDSEPARALQGLGAQVARGDLNEPASLDRALEGVWGAFAVQNTWEAGVAMEEEQGKRLADRAHKAGIQHFVYASVASADRKTGIPHFDNKWRIEQHVRKAGFPSYAILRPVFFMENFLTPWYKPGIDEGKLVMAVKPETKLQMIATSDIGRYGCMLFERHEEFNGRALDIAGDERTLPETARILGDAAHRKITFVRQNIEEVRKTSEDFALMLEWFDRVGYDVDVQKNAREYGIRPTSLQEWAVRVDWRAGQVMERAVEPAAAGAPSSADEDMRSASGRAARV